MTLETKSTSPDLTTFSSIAGRLRGFLASDGASTGLRAELRRMDVEAPTLAALSLIYQFIPQDSSTFSIKQWLAVAKAYALVGPARHDPKVALGSALKQAKLSEMRFERVLNSPESLLQESVYRTCRQLASKQVSFNLVDLARLLVYRDPVKVSAFRLQQAQAYLRS